ncbi:MAG: 16S rRNA (cytosine(1402)-N(4))-methyltransferase RsmH [Acidobacteriota bacterium]|jgi:16S rRNA (cytosine1402-N4)-methyltransferase|nr:16S rRNA (cytosine(1402)-N(4))-methyltransferase RsmH [Acidobacteriota bacterium]
MILHEPVLPGETIEQLAPAGRALMVDCTVGTGGHTEALFQAGATRVLGFDRDAEVLSLARERLSPWLDRLELVHGDYRAFGQALDERGIDRIDGALADLGHSTVQLETDGRGFSFRLDAPLDMRMDRSQGQTLAEMLDEVTPEALADVIYEYGEERHSRRIARRIIWARDAGELTTTTQLATAVRRSIRYRGRTRIDPATRTFQALRIWVNRELDGLDVFLRSLASRLAAGARMVIISFHSLEDRIVKHTLRELEQGGGVDLRVLTRRPVRPGPDEVSRNPRARSARLRAAERLA